ncbi:MAG: DUF2723 domain-containing protein [bacterium]
MKSKDERLIPFKTKDYIFGLLVLFVSFGDYLYTLAPTVTFGDSGDFISSAYTLGLPHPTGYPTYILLSHLITYLPIANIAFRINLLSSLFASLSCMLMYFITKRITFSLKEKDNINSVISGISASLLFAFSSVFWSQGLIAEVCTLHIFFLFAIILALLEIHILLSFFLFGLSLTNHLTSVLIFPAIVCWLILKRKPLFFKKIALILIFFSLGLLPYLYLPIRSLTHPVLDWANPTTLERFVYYVSGRQYTYLLSNQNILNNFFNWFSFLKDQFSILSLLALIGIIFLFKKSLKIFLLFLCLFLTNLVFSITYQTGIDQETYYLPSFCIWALFIGCGFKFLLSKIKNKIILWLLSLTFMISPFILASNVWYKTTKAKYYFAYDYGRDILCQLPFQSIIFNQADSDMFSIWYHRYIEEKRRDISPIHIKYLNKPWCLKRIKEENPNVKMEFLNADNTYQVFKALVEKNLDRGLYLTFNEDPILSVIKEKPINQGIIFSLNIKKDVIPSSYCLRNLYEKSAFRDQWTEGVFRIYANAYYQKALEYSEKRKYKEAILMFKKVEEIYPQFVDAEFLANRAQSYYFLGDYNNAVYEFQKSLLLHPDNPSAHNTLGICYYYLGNIEKALFHLKEALRIDPNNQSAYSNLQILRQK